MHISTSVKYISTRPTLSQLCRSTKNTRTSIDMLIGLAAFASANFLLHHTQATGDTNPVSINTQPRTTTCPIL
ncbi:hypothetical protein L596_002586 [Steinernema carpocapsae]|uniref:Uncharacterized protein n=1 Tax=Steinernema carpocapsae TaxID=34508 RepID=A0A4U8UPY8_STECR|nr:hypothetical protein L596_002586 [Steinernema carpocapsae]